MSDYLRNNGIIYNIIEQNGIVSGIFFGEVPNPPEKQSKAEILNTINTLTTVLRDTTHVQPNHPEVEIARKRAVTKISELISQL